MKVIAIFLIVAFIFTYFSNSVYAVTITINNYPTEITLDPFTMDVTIDGAGAGTNYLRIDLYKPSTTNYFGETFNGTDYYRGTDYTQYLKITILSGITWSGQLQGRVGEAAATEYDGPGTYKLRIRRYTTSGNNNSTEANNSAVDLNINIPIPTSTPTDTPIPSPSPLFTPEPTEIQSNPNPTPQSYDNIFISEAMVYPESNSNEWVEIFNNNDLLATLDNWYIDDIENGGSAPKKFSLTIPPKSYATFDLSSSIFNNDGDSVRLMDFNQIEKDSFQYQNAEVGKSLGRTSFDNDVFCLQIPSKGTNNNSCLNPTSANSTATNSPTPEKSISQLPTVTLKATNYLITINSQKSLDTIPTGFEENNILGASTEAKLSRIQQTKPYLLSLSFASFSYSIITLISVLLKLKIH